MKIQRKKSIVFSGLMILSFFALGKVQAQEPRLLFDTANAAYGNGHYEAARDAFRQLWDQGMHNGAVAFNLGNCYYKLGQMGPAVLFYERAARLMPSDEDVQANLSLARESIADRIEPRETFFLIRWWTAFLGLWPQNLLMILMLAFYGLFMLTLAGLIWTRRTASLRPLAVTLGLLWVVFALLFWGQWSESHRQNEAVILADSVSVMSAPNQEMAVELFVLHEGLKVTLDQRSNGWLEVILPDGKVGWVHEEAVEVI